MSGGVWSFDTGVVSCVIGTKFRTVHQAPNGYLSYMVFNDDELYDEIKTKGWIPIRLDVEVSSDIRLSSLQSKYVKYMQMRKEETWTEKFREVGEIIYVDHKFELKSEHIERLKGVWNRNILIRSTPVPKLSVWHEIRDGLYQMRYRDAMPRVIKFVEECLESGYVENVRVCNTGIIGYRMDSDRVGQLCDEMYRRLIELDTSECQVIWSMVSQPYDDIIQVLDWDRLDIPWYSPGQV